MWENEPINIGNRIMIHSVDGHRVFLDEDELHMSCHMIEHHVWEPQIREVIANSITEGDLYIDIGANIGLHALYAAAFVGDSGRVIVAEPNERLMKLLKMNMEVNGFYERCRFIQKAVSDREGMSTFYLYEGHASMSGFMKEHLDFEAMRTEIQVPVTTLNNIYDEIENDFKGKRKLLKIDVEGFEYVVLAGGKKILEDSDVTVILEWDSKVVIERCGEKALIETLDLFKSLDFSIYCARYTEKIVKLDFSDYNKIINQPFCDLVFTKKDDLDKVINKIDKPCSDEQRIAVEEDELFHLTNAEREELNHLRKAYVEAIEAQDVLKNQINELSAKSNKGLFRWKDK